MKKQVLTLKFIVPLLLFVEILGMYVSRLSPSIYGFDSGEFVAAVIERGFAHPSGYPLYTMLGLAANALPVDGSAAWKVGLVSVLAAACSVVLVYLISIREVTSKLLALIAALTVAFSYPFWLYAEVVEVFSLLVFFVLLLFLTAQIFNERKNLKWLCVLSFFAGLSLTHNQVIILFLPVLVLFVMRAGLKILSLRMLFGVILSFILGLLPYLYLPWSASKLIELPYRYERTVSGFVRYITRDVYGWGVTAPVNFGPEILSFYFFTLVRELTMPVLLLILAGIVYLIKHKRWEFLILCLGGFMFTGPFYLFYSRLPAGFFEIGLLERFSIVPLVLLLLIMPFGIKLIFELLTSVIPVKRGKMRVLELANFLFLIIPFWFYFSHRNSLDLSKVHIGDNLGVDILAQVPDESLLILHNDTPIYNAIYIQKTRDSKKGVFIPTDYSRIKDHYIFQKDIYEALDKRERVINQKYPEADPKIKLLLTLSELKESHGIFYLYDTGYNPENFEETLSFVPHGLMMKVADKNEINLSKEDFEKRQNALLGSLHVDAFEENKEIVETNYNFLHIRKIYATAYLNTSNHFRYYYKDEEKAKLFEQKAIEIDPFMR